MSADPRDAESVEAIVAAVSGLVVAVHRDDSELVIGQVGLLLAAIIEHEKSLAERPSDEALRRVGARLR